MNKVKRVARFFAEHRKAFVAAAGAAAVIIAQEFPESPYAQAALVAITFFGVKKVPNKPKE